MTEIAYILTIVGAAIADVCSALLIVALFTGGASKKLPPRSRRLFLLVHVTLFTYLGFLLMMATPMWDLFLLTASATGSWLWALYQLTVIDFHITSKRWTQ